MDAGLSIRTMATLLGISPTTYQHYERRYKKPYLPNELVEKVIPVLLAHGIVPTAVSSLTPKMDQILGRRSGDEETDSSGDVSAFDGRLVSVPVISWVEAERFLNTLDTGMSIESTAHLPVDYDRETVFALKMQGSALNRIAPPGALIIVDYALTGLVDGKFYIFKNGGGLRAGRYRIAPPRFEPFSTEPDHPLSLADDHVEPLGRIVQVVTTL